MLALSQGAYGHAILQDIGLISVIAILLAGFLYHWLSRAVPSFQWNQKGLVPTDGIVPLDILGCILFTLPFTLGLVLPFQEKAAVLSTSGIIFSFGILAMMAGLVCFIYSQRNILHETLGLSPKHPAQVISWALGAYIAFFVLTILLERAGLQEWLESRLGEQQNQAIVDEVIHATSPYRKLVLAIGACVIAPIAEEIIFRGYLYPVTKKYTEPVIAAIFTGVLFGAIHGQIWAVIPLSLFGILLAILYEKSGSIWACILCHSLFNSINVGIMLTMGDKL